MRDWDRNGRIDARDRYIFHEIILKDDNVSENDLPVTYKRQNKKVKSETTWGQVAAVWGVVIVLLVIKSIVGF